MRVAILVQMLLVSVILAGCSQPRYGLVPCQSNGRLGAYILGSGFLDLTRPTRISVYTEATTASPRRDLVWRVEGQAGAPAIVYFDAVPAGWTRTTTTTPTWQQGRMYAVEASDAPAARGQTPLPATETFEVGQPLRDCRSVEREFASL